MDQTTIIGAAVDLPGPPPGRIELMPVGVVRLADGRGPFRLDRAAEVAARSLAAAPGGVLPVDFDHALDGQGAGDGRAAGWITALAVEGERVVAEVEWTEDGRRAIEGRSYRFVSPVFTVSPGGVVTAILRAGLTNKPAMPQLRQIASRGGGMDPHLKTIAAALGLGAEADGEAVAAAVAERLGAGAPEPDPAAYVPVAAVAALSAQVAALQGEAARERAERAVTAAMSAGKLVPALEGWARAYAAKDPEGFRAWVEGQPAIVAATAAAPAAKAPRTAGTLTAEDRTVCAAMGLDEATFLAARRRELGVEP